MRRRTFLKTLAGGSAAALNFLYPDISKVVAVERFSSTLSASRKQDPDYDPDFAGGRVVKKMPEGLVLEVGENEFRAVRIVSDAAVWKEFDFRPNEVDIQMHDHIDARGTNLEDNSLLAQQIWINIGRWTGKVERSSENELVIRNRHGQLRAMEISSKADVISAKEGNSLPDHLLSLVPGDSIGAVGLRLPNGGFRATRVWRWEAEE